MCSMRRGRAPRSVRLGAMSAGLVGLTAMLAGCASERGATYSPSSAASVPMHHAGVRVEIEADGLPAQLAPRNHTIPADDPREPWSPNYGSAPPAKTGSLPTPAITVAVASVSASQPMIRSAAIDAEDIIRRAVAAHEMRQGD